MRLTFGHEPTPMVVDAMGEHLTMTLHIGSADAAALGPEAGVLAERFLSVLRGLAALRTGQVDRETDAGRIERGPATDDTWYWTLNDLHRLLPLLEGIDAAAVRAHAAAGGSVANLGFAMEVPKSTAQSRRERVMLGEPSPAEIWASTSAADFRTEQSR